MATKARTVTKVVAGAAAAASFMAVSSGTASADVWGQQATSSSAYWGSATADVLQYGVNSNEVGFWQVYLAGFGLVPSYAIDGRFGTGTKNGTITFQRFFGLPADGVVGNQTWTMAGNFTVLFGQNAQWNYVRSAYTVNWTTGWFQQFRADPYWKGYWDFYSCYTRPQLNTSSATQLSFVNGPLQC